MDGAQLSCGQNAGLGSSFSGGVVGRCLLIRASPIWPDCLESISKDFGHMGGTFIDLKTLPFQIVNFCQNNCGDQSMYLWNTILKSQNHLL